MTVITAIFEVFGQIGTWVVSQLGLLPAIFYTAEDGLTFLGVLAVAGLGFSVVFLLIRIIQGFLHFRG